MNEHLDGIKLKVYLAYDHLTVSELSELLFGMQNLTVRAAITWLIKKFEEQPHPRYDEDDPFYKYLMPLAYSYRARCRKSIIPIGSQSDIPGHYASDINHANCGTIFKEFLDEEILDTWIRQDIAPEFLLVNTIKDGHSILMSLTFVVAALLTSMPPIDYTMMKDMARYISTMLRDGLSNNPPQNTLEHIPRIIDKIRKNGNIKSFRIKVEGEKVVVKAKYKTAQQKH